ncbi:MAG TPA: IS701 family transposase [Actinomycetes bacterium]|nr:IS701 family transposase [Actinomycetes bacterium]
MTPTQLRRIRTRLVAFAEDLFEPMPRKDQRRWGQTYLRGLLLDGKRKSIQPMAIRLARGDPDADADALEQALQQFVNQSPWDPILVRRRLAQRMSTTIDPAAWVIDDTGFPKFGRWSVGVAPQYCGALGKVANCQVGVSIHAATDQASCPINWRLFLPESWDSDTQRRRKAHVPDGVGHRPKWQLALDMLDELATWGLAPPVVLADAAYGEVNGFRLGLEQREHTYVVQVPGTISAYPLQVVPETLPYAGRGQPSKPRYRQPRSSLGQLVLAAGEQAARTVAWREGVDGEPLVSRFVALRVRPAGRQLRQLARGTQLPVRWLLAEWPQGEPEPVKYWLASLPETTSLQQLVGLAKLRWRVEHDYRELKDALGLDHFEGRSFAGWHHHVTLVSVAHAFVTLERLDPKAAASA